MPSHIVIPVLSIPTEKKGEALRYLDFRHWQQIYCRNADARSDARSSLTLRYRYRFANAPTISMVWDNSLERVIEEGYRCRHKG